MNRTSVLLIIGLLLAAGSVQAEIYRWVDERGKVHYSDRPKSGGAQKLEISEPVGDTGEVDQQRLDAERNLREQRMLDAYREERDAREEEHRKAEQMERQRSQNCAYARNRLSRYGNRRLYQPQEDGSRRYLDQEERQQEIDRVKASIRRWCDS